MFVGKWNTTPVSLNPGGRGIVLSRVRTPDILYQIPGHLTDPNWCPNLTRHELT